MATIVVLYPMTVHASGSLATSPLVKPIENVALGVNLIGLPQPDFNLGVPTDVVENA